MNFRALEKSESWKSPENLFWKKVTNPVFRMQQFYFLIFVEEVKVGGGGGGGEWREDRKRICDEEGDYGLSIKYHKPPSNPTQNEQFLMRDSS